MLNDCNFRRLCSFWVKSGKTIWPCALAGLFGMLPEAWDLCDKRRQQAPAQVLPDLQRKGQERKEASQLT